MGYLDILVHEYTKIAIIKRLSDTENINIHLTESLGP